MPDVVATAGSSKANSFVTLDYFESWLDTRLNAVGLLTSRTADDRSRALIDATRDITRINYAGTRVTLTQALSWPRIYAPDPDKPNLSNVTDISFLYFGETEIPQRVKNATCEWALELLRAGSTDAASADPNANISSKVVGPLETDFIDPVLRVTGLAKYPRIMSELAPLLDSTQSGGGLDIVRC